MSSTCQVVMKPKWEPICSPAECKCDEAHMMFVGTRLVPAKRGGHRAECDGAICMRCGKPNEEISSIPWGRIIARLNDEYGAIMQIGLRIRDLCQARGEDGHIKWPRKAVLCRELPNGAGKLIDFGQATWVAEPKKATRKKAA